MLYNIWLNAYVTPHFHDVVQVKDSYLDITKLKSYGFEIKYPVEEVIKKLVNYYKK
jgi:hypothetical protein